MTLRTTEEKGDGSRGEKGKLPWLPGPLLAEFSEASKQAPRPDASLVDEMDALVATKRYEY